MKRFTLTNNTIQSIKTKSILNTLFETTMCSGNGTLSDNLDYSYKESEYSETDLYNDVYGFVPSTS